MNAERLLKHFERISEAPGAVPRLRQFILDLAVRGKLVEQDPGDEPATALLARIETRWHELQTHGTIRKREKIELPSEDDYLFPVPNGWAVARMGALALKLGAGSTPTGGKSVYLGEGIPFLRSQNVHNDGLKLDDVAFISPAIHERMAVSKLQDNDILLNITGASIGRCALLPLGFGEGNVSQHVAIIRLVEPLLREFIHLSLISPSYQKLIMDVQVGVSREGLSMSRLILFPMAIPPLAEQGRIVARVDELMALCDQLEVAQTEREERRDRLVAATLDRMQNSDMVVQDRGNRTEEQDACFFFSHLPRLTRRPEHIEQLRQMILSLAVKGQLVAQESDDEPASNLIKRISMAREQLVAQGQLRDDIVQPSSSLAVYAHSIPETWTWVMLGDITSIGTGSTPARTTTDYWQNGDIPWITSGLTSQSVISAASEYVTQSAVDQCRLRLYIPGTLIVALYGQGKTRGQVSTLGIAATVNQACAAVCSIPGFEQMQDYLKLVLTKNYDELRSLAAGGTQPNLNVRKIKEIFVPLPPLAEQARIVSKVGELMALCDGLQVRVAGSVTVQDELLVSLLHEAIGE